MNIINLLDMYYIESEGSFLERAFTVRHHPERVVFMANPPKDCFSRIKHFILEIFIIISMLIVVARFLISEIKSLLSLF